MERRTFIKVASAVTGAAVLNLGASQRAEQRKIKAVAFDAFPIFDYRPIFAQLDRLFPGKAEQLGAVWRTRQFEYQWLRALAGHYCDFVQTTSDALEYAAQSLHLPLTPAVRHQCLQPYFELAVWPDVKPALERLRNAGVRLALLSNATPTMLNRGISRAGLDGTFEHVLSSDQVRSFKPSPQAYAMGVDAFKLRREEIGFGAFASWDAAGAKWFGYDTFWVNRAHAVPDQLGVAADGEGETLTALADHFLGERDST